jgi:arylformamidase
VASRAISLVAPGMNHSGWIDISVPVKEGLSVWPGDPPVRLRRISSVEQDGAGVMAVEMSLHAGTHIDPPAHYLLGGCTLDRMPIEATCGRARVVEIDRETIDAESLTLYNFQPGERVLLKTRNSARRWYHQPPERGWVALTADGAKYLADRQVQAVGIDGISVGTMEEKDGEVHRTLLAAGIWLIEGLDLEGVEPGDYELMCLPLRVEESDGAPARAVVRPWAGGGE